MKRTGLVTVIVALAIVAGLGWLAFQPTPRARARAVVQGLAPADDTQRFSRALAPRDLVFPADHGPHNDFQTEWWYYTGNLSAADGRRFGYQFTVFRRALSPDAPDLGGSLSANQLYFAHFAVTDVAANAHRGFQKFSRGAGGLAGAEGDPFRVFIEDWSTSAVSSPRRAGMDASAVRIVAQADGYAIDLTLDGAKPMVQHGDRGLSQKSPEPGNASFYYSFTRMDTRGRVVTPSGAFETTGLSWMDHEWSTSVLDPKTRGWDWFSLQLSDGTELMYFRLWQEGGGEGPSSSGTWVMADGRTQALTRADVRITPSGAWRSPNNGASYPSGWRIEAPSVGLDAKVIPLIADQEMDLSSVYWEGAVSVVGVSGGRAVSGYGYVELTGYAEAMNEKL